MLISIKAQETKEKQLLMWQNKLDMNSVSKCQ